MERLTTSEQPRWPNSWSSDGSTLAFGQLVSGRAGEIMFYRPGGDPEVETATDLSDPVVVINWIDELAAKVPAVNQRTRV